MGGESRGGQRNTSERERKDGGGDSGDAPGGPNAALNIEFSCNVSFPSVLVVYRVVDVAYSETFLLVAVCVGGFSKRSFTARLADVGN